MHIRTATNQDVPAMVELAAQLGYAISRDEFARRLGAYAGRPDYIALVAIENGRAVGFANGGLRLDLVYPAMAELESLVVHESARNRGVGKALLAEFETWARAHEAQYIKLGSRETRKDAHRFYLREGFELEKVHHILRKRLE